MLQIVTVTGQQRNLSQNSVAERIDKSATYISYIESGIKHPSLETLVDLANLLGVTADMLLGENLEHTRLVMEEEYQQILHDCTDLEKRFLVESAKALKFVLRAEKFWFTTAYYMQRGVADGINRQ